MLISLFPAPFDHFHFHRTLGLDPVLILTLRLTSMMLRIVFEVDFSSDCWSDCSVQLDCPTRHPSKPHCSSSSHSDPSNQQANKRTKTEC